MNIEVNMWSYIVLGYLGLNFIVLFSMVVSWFVVYKLKGKDQLMSQMKPIKNKWLRRINYVCVLITFPLIIVFAKMLDMLIGDGVFEDGEG